MLLKWNSKVPPRVPGTGDLMKGWQNKCAFKLGLSSSTTKCLVCYIESPLKIMKNDFYFILKALFVFKIFDFLTWLFSHVEKMASLER